MSSRSPAKSELGQLGMFEVNAEMSDDHGEVYKQFGVEDNACHEGRSSCAA